MSETIELLTRQHQDVLAQLAEFESRLGTDSDGAAAGLAGYLQRDVVQHFTVEENALFPVLGRHIGVEHGPLAVMNAEHATFRELLHGLASGVQSGDRNRQQACAHGLIELLRGHIMKEDNILFPMASRLLSPAEQHEVDTVAATLAAAAP